MRLGELLVHEGLVTADGLAEALESQVVHGGRLGTNLLELGLLKEADLAKALGKLHRVHFASGEMKAAPGALELVDVDFADKYDLLPMRVEQTRLILAVMSPWDLTALDTVRHMTGKRVQPVVIPEFRMHQLLRRYCKAFRTIRAIDMNTVRPSRTLETAEAPKERGADLMSEEDFTSLYAKAVSGDAAAPQVDEAEVESDVSVVGEVVDEATAVPISGGVTPSVVVEPVGPRQMLEPLAFAEAQQLLQTSDDREDVARTILRFALSKWKRALLLSVQGDLMTGWHGAGAGVDEAIIQRIGIALAGPSPFKLVRDTSAHFVGPIRQDGTTQLFYKSLGGEYPKTAVLLPLLARGRVVHVLYVDDGPKQLTTPDVGELLILSQSVGRSYDAMMRRRTGH